jgi:hypothetical protein
MWSIGRRTNGRRAEVLGEILSFSILSSINPTGTALGLKIGPSSFNLRAVPIEFVLDKVLFPVYVLTSI